MAQPGMDLFLVYSFVKRLSTPFKETSAYKLGLIDEKGKTLKKASSKNEKNAMTYYDKLIFNLKRLLAKLTGVEGKMTTFAAALLLLKESEKTKNKRRHFVTEDEFRSFRHNNKKLIESLVLTEDAPANAVAGGNIAGAGPGEDPPIRKKVIARYKKKNKEEANTIGRKTFSSIRTA
jgi:hypothetical protein|tara:strand:- start:2798 stop:3328 length:531 start_codon:yes stop_codon:yes gene_type:complete